jgi:hypothetical protein
LDSLSSTFTMRSNICGGGPSIDSKAIVAPGPALAMAKAPLPAPPPAQPPSPLAIANMAAAAAMRVAVFVKAWGGVTASLMHPSDIVKMR